MSEQKYSNDIDLTERNVGFDSNCDTFAVNIGNQCLLDDEEAAPAEEIANRRDPIVSKKYRNRLIINQRGGSLSINNTTDNENIQLSQRSGSNINLNNLVNSEFASNNKQTLVSNDNFETIKGDSSEFISGDYNQRVGGSSYIFKGFKDEGELRAHEEWKDAFSEIATNNSKFKIKRGGVSLPNGPETELNGTRAKNPVIGSQIVSVENTFGGYNIIPIRTSLLDGVSFYTPVLNRIGQTAQVRSVTRDDIDKSAGRNGSRAPGVLEFGADVSAATENGKWEADQTVSSIDEQVKDIQPVLTEIESSMGNGGDEHIIIKRNRLETIGATFNDYPSVKIDEKGRSQPFEMLVGETGTFKNHDYVPLLEEIDNSSNFPCGKDTKVVGNSYSRNVGSGGINLKTTGSFEMGGTILRTGFKQLIMNASHGVHIGSENGVEIQSLKTITLRTNRQVYVESSLGVKNNVIVGGGLSVEGETYLQHVTAPLEVQQTEDTIVTGGFTTLTPRTLIIAEALVNGAYCPVFALPLKDIITMYPHSHHFNNLPLTLMESNKEVRKIAHTNGINRHDSVAPAFPQVHAKKVATIDESALA